MMTAPRLALLRPLVLLRWACLWAACLWGISASAEPITLTDIAGRSVTLPGPARRIVLAEGRQIFALALLLPDPVAPLAGWSADLKRRDGPNYARVKAKFPAVEQVPLVGEESDASFSVEKALSVHPDLVILSGRIGAGRPEEVVKQFTAAGVPVIFVDFYAHPFQNTVPSMRILGRALGREAQAEAYAAFYAAHMARIAERLDKPGHARPKVLMEAHAGAYGECCNSPGRGSIGDFIAFAGGQNIAAEVLTGTHGHLSLEYVLSADPAVYVATGGTHLAGTGGLVLGPGIPEAEARATLAGLTARTGIAQLAAVREGHVHGLYHNLINMPTNVLVAEVLAKWIHPELFADLDPRATLQEMNARFLAVPLEGSYWIDLAP